MNKSLIALAALTAFAGAASAQSTVTIGGKLDLGFGKSIGSTDKGIQDAAGSRLNFLIVEDLGGGLKAVGGMEHRFNPDSGTDASANPTTTPPTARSNFWNGFSYVGLQGGFGRVVLGRTYTAAFTHLQNQIDPFGGDTVAALRNIALIPGAAAGTPGRVRFGNGLKYDIAAGGLGFAFDIAESGYSNWGTPAARPNKPWSVAANYSAGSMFVGLAHENEGDANTKLTALGGRFGMGALTLRGGLSRGTNASGFDVKGYLIAADYQMGAGNFRIGYANGRTDTALAPIRSKKIGVGYHYDLSKRTKLYADFARDSGDIPASATSTSRVGYDFGIQHNF